MGSNGGETLENQLKLHSLLAEKEELQQRYEEIQIEHSSLSSENVHFCWEKSNCASLF